MKIWLLASTLLLSAQAAYGIKLKVAALVPEGTTWAENLKQIAKEVKKETNGRVKFKLYLDGVAGDEPDVQRKIRVGQLHGGIFTGKALGDIYGDIRLMEVPFSFNHDRSRALQVLDGMSPHFNKGFESKGYTNLGFLEVGKVYIVSKKKFTSIDSMKGVKIWAWEGDELGKAMLESLSLISVPLALPDVLTSLSTGIIDSAYASPLAILALQWQSKIKYLVDVPVVYSFGAFLLGHKAWKKIKPADQKIITSIAKKYIRISNDATIKENGSSLTALKGQGIEFVEFPKTDIAQGVKVRGQVINKLTGNLFSKQGVDLFTKQLNQSSKSK